MLREKRKYFSRDAIRQVFESVLEFEAGTRDLYDDYIIRLSDSSVRDVFRQLRDEEVRHVESVQAILKMIR